MNFNNFFNRLDYGIAKFAVDNKQPFKIKGEYKKQEIKIESLTIDSDTAKSIWNGINYLISVDKWNGTCGSGYATTDYSMFDDFNSFISFIDNALEHVEGYEKHETIEEQLSFF